MSRWTKEYSAATRVVHVIPVGDMKEHEHRSDCWCRPKLDNLEEGTVVVHNSLDGRELYEDDHE